jgi:hypothetical protein
VSVPRCRRLERARGRAGRTIHGGQVDPGAGDFYLSPVDSLSFDANSTGDSRRHFIAKANGGSATDVREFLLMEAVDEYKEYLEMVPSIVAHGMYYFSLQDDRDMEMEELRDSIPRRKREMIDAVERACAHSGRRR